MPYSSGVYSAPASTWNPAVAATAISVADWTALLADFTTAFSTALLKDGSQTATAIVPFASGITVSGGSTLATYAFTTTATTFTFDGTGGNSASVTLSHQKIGNWVTINIPAALATSGTSSTVQTSNTAIPAAYRPTATQNGSVPAIKNNGTAQAGPGYISISTAGIITIYRDPTLAATYTNTSANCGLAVSCAFTYFTG